MIDVGLTFILVLAGGMIGGAAGCALTMYIVFRDGR